MTPSGPGLSAISLGTAAEERLREGHVGLVHSVFPRALNIASTGGMLCIVRSDVGKGPVNVVVDLDPGSDFGRTGVSPGTHLHRKGDELTFGAEILSVHLGPCARYPGPSSPIRVLSRPKIAVNLGILEELILSQGNLAGLGSLLPVMSNWKDGVQPATSHLAAVALPNLLKLTAALKARNLVGLSSAARGLIGLGPGLTPAADDTICGLMIALLLACKAFRRGEEYAEVANLSMCRWLEGRTTTLSAEFLLQAARGLGSEHVMTLVHELLAGEPANVETAALRTFGIGATSGTDTSLGVLLGVEAAVGFQEPGTK